MHTPSRLSALRRWLQENNLDGMIVPRADAWQSEYCAPYDEKLAWLTGFDGSAGLALILKNTALLFVDGRYQVQARLQVIWMKLKSTICTMNRWPNGSQPTPGPACVLGLKHC